MLSWTIQITVISIILIFLVHHLINFFKSTLTVPKIKDLVNTPTEKYENIYNIIYSHKTEQLSEEKPFDYTINDLLPKSENNMKKELKNFLKKQLNKQVNSTDINTLEPISNSMNLSYSNY
jgi:hypothetical protein